MKKIAFLLIVFVVIIASVGLCEESALTSLTDEQLNELLVAVEQEIANRDDYLSNFYGPDVVYTVGDDIEPGVYIVSCVKKYNSALTGARIDGWKTEEDYKMSPDEPSAKPFIVLGESTKIKLEEGNVFVIQGGILTFAKIG